VNNVICHGIPSWKEILKDGDIVNIDVTTILEGFHGDTSRTFFVGDVTREAKQLVRGHLGVPDARIAQVKPGARIRDIGSVIQDYAEGFGYAWWREYVGHGRGPHLPRAAADPALSRRRARTRGFVRHDLHHRAEINLARTSRARSVDAGPCAPADGKSPRSSSTPSRHETGHDVLTDWNTSRTRADPVEAKPEPGHAAVPRLGQVEIRRRDARRRSAS